MYTIDSSRVILHPRWRNLEWHYLLDSCHNFSKFPPTETILSTRFYWQLGIDQWSQSAVPIINRVTAYWEIDAARFLKSKSITSSKVLVKNAPATLNSSDLSLGTQWSRSQPHDTIPLMYIYFWSALRYGALSLFANGLWDDIHNLVIKVPK